MVGGGQVSLGTVKFEILGRGGRAERPWALWRVEEQTVVTVETVAEAMG